MPGDDYRQVMAGHRQVIPAQAWNAMIAAQRVPKDHAHDRAADLAEADPSTGLVLVRNNSGAHRSPLDVLGVSGPLILPSVNKSEFERRVMLTGILPDFTSSGRFVLCYDAIRAGEIGRAVIDGVTPGRLDVPAGTETFGCADVIPGVADALQAVEGGSGTQILWKESGTGLVNAIFRLGPTCAAFPSSGSGSGSGGGGCNCTIFPAYVAVTSSGFTGAYALFNGTFHVTGHALGSCSYSVTIPDPSDPIAVGGQIIVDFLFGTVSFYSQADPGNPVLYYLGASLTSTLPDCCGPWTATHNPGDTRTMPSTIAAVGSCAGGGSGGGSGSGSGGGGGSGDCTALLNGSPAIIHVTLTNIEGCACIAGTYALGFAGVGAGYSTITTACGESLTILFGPGGTPTACTLQIICAGSTSAHASPGSTCSPIALSFDGLGFMGCCPGTFKATVTS